MNPPLDGASAMKPENRMPKPERNPNPTCESEGPTARSFGFRASEIFQISEFGNSDVASAPDRTREVRDAFKYDWRLWPVHELAAHVLKRASPTCRCGTWRKCGINCAPLAWTGLTIGPM